MQKVLKIAKGSLAAILAVNIVCLGLIAYIWFGVLGPFYNQPNDLKYTSDYDASSGLVADKVLDELSTSENYELGVNDEGTVVFKNPRKAYKTALKECKAGIKFEHKNYDIKHRSRTYYMAYITTAEDVQKNDEATQEEKEQAQKFADVLTIYANSFNKHR